MRRLCPECRQPATDEIPERLRRYIPRGAPLFRAVGCAECAMTGYRGRFCIVEVLTMNAEIERLIGAGSPADRIAEAARANGMRPLWWSGLRHVLSGETAVEELLRVTDFGPVVAAVPRPDSGRCRAARRPVHGRGSGHWLRAD